MITLTELERRRMESSADLALARAADDLASFARLRTGSGSVATGASGFYKTDVNNKPIYTNYWLAGDLVGSATPGP